MMSSYQDHKKLDAMLEGVEQDVNITAKKLKEDKHRKSVGIDY